jgi:hypothetical protein
MDNSTIGTIIITAITVFGSEKAWKYYERRSSNKEESENYIKNNCTERINKLESLLKRASVEKDEMRATILTLTSQVAELKVKVEYLEQENVELKSSRRRKNLDE